MCGRGFGNLIFPLAVAGVLSTQTMQPAPVVATQGICPNCKTAVLSEYAWCPQCGTGLKSQPCAYCGSQMETNARYCPSCGAPGRNE